MNRARMDCAGKAATSSDREAARAAQWFGSESEEPGSFLWVCSHLGMCPKMIRSRLPQEKNPSQPGTVSGRMEGLMMEGDNASAW